MLETVAAPGNIHNSVVFDAVYNKVTRHFPETEAAAADAAYKTPPYLQEGLRCYFFPL